MLDNRFEEAVQTYKTGTPGEQGLLTGVIVTEIIAAAMGVAELRQAAKLAKAGQMTRTMEKLIERPVMQAPARQTLCSRLRDKLKAFREWIDPWCFVAGTLVATPAGAVPIESVRAGDLVWSRDPDTFLTEPRPVRETYVSHPAELFHVGVDRDGDHRADETISGTGSHPWYVLTPGRVGFVPARELQSGDILSLRDGTRAWVADKTREVAPPGQTFTTYNFAVADHHTYFAGVGGVWVHNLCGEALDRAIAFNKLHLDEFAGDWNQAIRKTLQKYDEAAAATGGKTLAKLSTKDRGEIASALIENAGKDIRFDEAEELLGIIRQSFDLGDTANPLSMVVDEASGVAALGFRPGINRNIDNFSDVAKSLKLKLLQNGYDEATVAFSKVARHSEGSSLARYGKQMEDTGKAIPQTVKMVTEGYPVCSGCVNTSHKWVSDGLPAIAKVLGLDELVLTAQTFEGVEGVTSVVIKNGFLQ